MYLVHVPKLLVLPVCHVTEPNIRLMTRARSVSSTILPAVVEEQQRNSAQDYTFNRNNCNLGRRIVRCVVVAERQRPEDITKTKRHEQNCVHGDLFGVALGSSAY